MRSSRLLMSAILSVALVGALYRVASAPSRQWEVAAVAASSTSTGNETGEFVMPAQQEFAQLSERPLFSSTRRPLPVVPAVAAAGAPGGGVAPPPPPPNLLLLGILVSPQARLALIRIPGAQSAQRLTVGQTVGGWEVTHILEDHIVLRSGAMDREVKVAPPSQASGKITGGIPSSPAFSGVTQYPQMR